MKVNDEILNGMIIKICAHNKNKVHNLQLRQDDEVMISFLDKVVDK